MGLISSSSSRSPLSMNQSNESSWSSIRFGMGRTSGIRAYRLRSGAAAVTPAGIGDRQHQALLAGDRDIRAPHGADNERQTGAQDGGRGRPLRRIQRQREPRSTTIRVSTEGQTVNGRSSSGHAATYRRSAAIAAPAPTSFRHLSTPVDGAWVRAGANRQRRPDSWPPFGGTGRARCYASDASPAVGDLARPMPALETLLHR